MVTLGSSRFGVGRLLLVVQLHQSEVDEAGAELVSCDSRSTSPVALFIRTNEEGDPASLVPAATDVEFRVAGVLPGQVKSERNFGCEIDLISLCSCSTSHYDSFRENIIHQFCPVVNAYLIL